MRDEIAAAVVFITRLVKRDPQLTKEKADEFSNTLSRVLLERFHNHWYKKQPIKGQAYRCIRVNERTPIDATLERVAKQAGLSYDDLYLPSEFTLWIDPEEVICRFGEEGYAAYVTIATFREENTTNQAETLDIDTILHTHFRQRSSDLAKFQATVSHRQQKSKPVRNYHTTGKKLSYGDGQPFFRPNSYLSHGIFSTRRSPSPEEITYDSNAPCNRTASPIHGNDRYHWSRGQGEMVVAAV